MGRKVLGTTLVLVFVGVSVLIARDHLSLDDWTAHKGDDAEPPDDSAQG